MFKLSLNLLVVIQILNSLPLSWDEAVGDHVGLFTINYLNRILKEPSTAIFNRTAYLDVVRYVVKDFIGKWPYRLPDGTFSRLKGWPNAETSGNASFVWADDQYMGLTLLARYALVTKDRELAKQVGQLALNFGRLVLKCFIYCKMHIIFAGDLNWLI